MNIMGEYKMSADEVISTQTKVPKREDIVINDTARRHDWLPISHSYAVLTTLQAFERHQIKVIDSAFALNRTKHLLVGGFLVEGDCLPAMPKNIDGQYQLFFRHANDMSLSLQLQAGVEIFLCTNGLLLNGTPIGSHKHTKSFFMESWMSGVAIPNFITACESLDSTVKTLQETPVTDAQAHKFILESGRLGILPLARLTDVYRQWHGYDETFSKSDFEPNTAFKLYQDCTFVAQRTSANRQLKIIEKTHELIMDTFCQN